MQRSVLGDDGVRALLRIGEHRGELADRDRGLTVAGQDDVDRGRSVRRPRAQRIRGLADRHVVVDEKVELAGDRGDRVGNPRVALAVLRQRPGISRQRREVGHVVGRDHQSSSSVPSRTSWSVM